MNEIPKYDPYTGELNPYYEELTGEKNPYQITYENEPIKHNFNFLMGKTFKYESKYGLSNWVDIVEDVLVEQLVNYDDTYRVQVYIISSKSKHKYELDHCVFLI